jgi:hypothetical protein
VSFGRVVTLSGVGSLGYGSVELDYGADVAMNGDYTLVDATATGNNRVWTMKASNGVTYAIRPDSDRGWRVDNEDTGSNIFYTNPEGYENPWIDETTSITWWAGPNDCPHIKTLPKADSSSEPEDTSVPLTLTAEQANSTVTLKKTISNPVVYSLVYRTDSSAAWMDYDINTLITLSKVGDYVQFKNTASTLNTSANVIWFGMSGKIAASGNIQSMLNWSDSCTDYCYHRSVQWMYIFNKSTCITCY